MNWPEIRKNLTDKYGVTFECSDTFTACVDLRSKVVSLGPDILEDNVESAIAIAHEIGHKIAFDKMSEEALSSPFSEVIAYEEGLPIAKELGVEPQYVKCLEICKEDTLRVIESNQRSEGER